MMEIRQASVNLQGSARLEEIRASLAAGGAGTSAIGSGQSGQTPSLTKGDSAAAGTQVPQQQAAPEAPPAS
jgi:hypothetical protein